MSLLSAGSMGSRPGAGEGHELEAVDFDFSNRLGEAPALSLAGLMVESVRGSTMVDAAAWSESEDLTIFRLEV